MITEKKQLELAASDALVKGHRDLNERQRDVLLHALRHPGTEYTIQLHTDLSKVTYGTARADLLGLAVRGLMDQVKTGKSIIFTLSPHLDEHLKQE
jgi:Fic family protein